MYTEQEAALVAAAHLRAQEHHTQYDPSHDFFHVDRVRRLALAIAHSLDGVDLLVVELAALFHDLIDAKYLPKNAPKPTARETLDPFWARHDTDADRQILDGERRRLVERIVDNVSYSKEVKRIAAGQQTEWHLECLELHWSVRYLSAQQPASFWTETSALQCPGCRQARRHRRVWYVTSRSLARSPVRPGRSESED